MHTHSDAEAALPGSLDVGILLNVVVVKARIFKGCGWLPLEDRTGLAGNLVRFGGLEEGRGNAKGSD